MQMQMHNKAHCYWYTRHYYAAWVGSCTNFVHSAQTARSTAPWWWVNLGRGDIE